MGVDLSSFNADQLLQKLAVAVVISADNGLDCIESASTANSNSTAFMRELRSRMALGDDKANQALLNEYIQLTLKIAEQKRESEKTKARLFQNKARILQLIPKQSLALSPA